MPAQRTSEAKKRITPFTNIKGFLGNPWAFGLGVLVVFSLNVFVVYIV